MKKCHTCSQEKQLSEFYRKPSGRMESSCKPCCNAYSRQHYTANKARYFASNGARKRKVRERLIEYKTGRPCADCGVSYPHYVMDFDHLPGFEKKRGVARQVSFTTTWSALLKEIKKCELVCSNCHRQRTWTRKESAKTVKPA